MRTAISAACLLLGPALCMAQSNVAKSCLADPANPAAAPVIRAAVSAQFATALECVANGDGDCAEAALDEIDDDDLNDDELAVLWLNRGDAEALQGSSRRARREYRRVINQRDGSRPLVAAAIERTAIRHVEDDNNDDASEALEDLACGEWTPELVYLQARAQFGSGQFSAAQANSQTAINAKDAAGGDIPTAWRSLLTASTQQAQQAASEQVVCTRERTSNSNIPVRVCTTQSQRRAEAAEAAEIMSGDSVVEIDTIR